MENRGIMVQNGKTKIVWIFLTDYILSLYMPNLYGSFHSLSLYDPMNTTVVFMVIDSVIALYMVP